MKPYVSLLCDELGGEMSEDLSQCSEASNTLYTLKRNMLLLQRSFKYRGLQRTESLIGPMTSLWFLMQMGKIHFSWKANEQKLSRSYCTHLGCWMRLWQSARSRSSKDCGQSSDREDSWHMQHVMPRC